TGLRRPDRRHVDAHRWGPRHQLRQGGRCSPSSPGGQHPGTRSLGLAAGGMSAPRWLYVPERRGVQVSRIALLTLVAISGRLIRSFGSKNTERIGHEQYVKRVERTVQRATTMRQLELIHAAKDVDDLGIPPGNRL